MTSYYLALLPHRFAGRRLRDILSLQRNATIVPSETILETWRHPGVANADLGEDIARLKSMSGKQILAHGGLAFAQNLIEHDLIDRYDLHVHPAVLGRGGSPFSLLKSPACLELVDLKREITTMGGLLHACLRPRWHLYVTALTHLG